MKYVSIQNNESVCEVILNRPPVNALNEKLVSELGEVFQRLEKDDEVRVVILRSNLSSFVAGADIKMMHEMQKEKEAGRMLTYLKEFQNTLNLLENMSKPTIAYINGHAMGGGLELALACDFRVMSSSNAKIGLPEVQLGMIPGAGGTQRLTRLVGETKAKEIIYFAQHLSAEEAYSYGIVSYVVHPDKGLEKTYEIANDLALQAPLSLAGVKLCIQSAGQKTLLLGLEKEMSETAKVFTSVDAEIGFGAFLENKKPVFYGR